jgi:hypothetical protein
MARCMPPSPSTHLATSSAGSSARPKSGTAWASWNASDLTTRIAAALRASRPEQKNAAAGGDVPVAQSAAHAADLPLPGGPCSAITLYPPALGPSLSQ